MLKEIQYDYLSDHIIHADFLRLDLDKPITAWVPVVVKGEPIGVKLEDGILDFITRDIQVKCLATKIPKEIVVDISGLHSGHSIKAEDLELGEDIQSLSDPHRVICAVTSKIKAEVEVEVEVEEEAAEAPAEEAEAEKEEESTEENK
jgi:large subunit ribosomal protein L25